MHSFIALFSRDALQEMWDSVHLTWEEAWSDHLDRKSPSARKKTRSTYLIL